MANKKEIIDVRLSAASKKDLMALSKELADAVNSVNKLAKGFQNLSQLKASASAKGAVENNFGLGAYSRGLNQSEKQRATNTARLGTETGRVADERERDLRATQKLMKTQEGLQRIEQARLLNAKAELKTVDRLVDRGELLKKQDLARVKAAEAQLRLNDLLAQRDVRNRAIRKAPAGSDERRALQAQAPAANAQIRGVQQEVQAAERLNTLAGSRLQTLQQETAQKAQQAKFDRESERMQSRSLTSQTSLARDRERRQQAQQLNLTKELEGARRINDLVTAKTQKLRAQDRLRLEEQNGNLTAVRQARVLNDLLDRRIRKLQEANRVAKEAAKPTKEQMAGNAREMSMKRLFGDNGASLFAIQAGLVANYALMNQLRTGFQQAIAFTVDLDSAMRNLQAIVRITDTDLASLKDSLIGISEETKFTAVEVANAAVTLGQAGFSTDEIKDSIRAVSLLATATGTELKNAVDIATSTLGVFNMESSQMADVANILTEAVNTSKLNIEKLTLGLQYSGNIAAQSGVSFKELTSALGAMANAGIRSGSTLGTGMRQILIALQKPSNEFSATLDRLGLTMDDVNLETKGLYGALKNLRDAGFSSGDAIQSFEVRAAAAYNALSGNLDQMLSLQNAFQRTSASIQANETQMKSLANQGKRLGSVLGSVAAAGLDPMLKGTIAITSALADAFSWVRQFENSLAFLTTGVAVAGLSGILVYFGRMIKNLSGMVLGTNALTAANLRATVSYKALSVAMMRSPFALVAGAITAIGAAFYFMGNRTTGAQDKLEKAQTTFDRSVGSAEKLQKGLVRVDDTLKDLTNRYDLLKDGGALLESVIIDIQKQFVDMGRDAGQVGNDVDALIKTMRDLRMELSKEYELRINTSLLNLDNLRNATRKSLSESIAGTASAASEMNPLSASERKSGVLRSNQGGFGSQILDDAKILQTSGSSLNEVGSANARLDAVRLKIEDRLDNDSSANKSLDRAWLDYIGAIREKSDQTSSFLQTIEQLNAQELAQIEQSKIAADGGNASVFTLREGAKEIATDVRAKLMSGLGGMSAQERTKTVAQRYEAFDKEIAEATRSLESLKSNGTIQSTETYDLIRRMLLEASASASSMFRGIKEESDKVVEKLTDLNLQETEVELQKLADEFGEAQGLQAIGEAMAAQKIQLEKVRAAEIASVQAQGLDSDVEAATLTATNRQYDDRSAGIDAAGLEKINAILDAQRQVTLEGQKQVELQNLILEKGQNSLEVEQFKLQQEKLSTAETLRKAGVEEGFVQAKLAAMQTEFDLAQRIKAQEANKDLSRQIEQRKEENRIAKATLIFGEDSLVVVKMREKAERDALDVTLEASDASEELKEQLRNALKEAQAIGRADMSSGINNAIGRAGALIRQLRIARSVLSTIDKSNAREKDRLAVERATVGDASAREVGLAGLETRYKLEDDGVTDVVGIAAGVGLAKADEAVLAADRRKLEAEEEAYSESQKDPSGGGGGGGKGKKDKNPEYDALQTQLSNRIGAATISIDNGGDPAAAYQQIEMALQRINVEVEKREQLITSIAGKQSRSVQEEERLKQLISEHNQLTTFAKTEEEKILWLKEQQGQASVNLKEIVREWSREALVGVVALEEGMKNVLGNLLTGFGTLFTDLVSGVKSAKEAFREFAVSVVKSLLQVIAKLIAIKILKSILGGIAGGGGRFAGFAQSGLDFLSNKEGGRVQRKVGGGRVEGNLARDSVPHSLMPDEYVLRASAARAIGYDKLNQINATGNTSRMNGLSNVSTDPQNKGSGMGDVNVYVISPDQKPIPGPRDIIAVMDDHISKGGSTKKLIKSVSMGEI